MKKKATVLCTIFIFFIGTTSYSSARNERITKTSDNRSNLMMSVPIFFENIIPVVISASTHDGNGPNNMVDDNFDTRWSAQGDGQWAMFDLGSIKKFDQIQIAFQYGNQRTSNFDIQISNDATNWTNVLTNINSSGTTLALEDFNFSSQDARYIRYLGHGNSIHNWNSITEIKINRTASSGESHWTLSGTDIHYITGNVGIGTINPGIYKLAVNGAIHTKEVRVDLTGWPDYVFEKDYLLPTLEEVEKHIQKKGHLMNMPSAAEVEANGIQLGEMNRLLLEKIEELTLYILKQNTVLKKQAQNQKRFKERLVSLEKTNNLEND